MTPALITAIVGTLTALAALIKQISDNIKIKTARLETAKIRDEDSQKLHDQVLRNTFDITALKDNQVHHVQLLEDLRDQVTALNVSMASYNANMVNLTKAVEDALRRINRVE